MSPDELLELAKRADRGSRSALFEQITDLLLSEENRLSDRERSLMQSILHRLFEDVERAVRTELSQRLADDPSAPPEVIELLASDEEEIAVPVQLRSHALRDETLMRIIRDRGREHCIAIASRRDLSPDVSDTIVDRAQAEGDEGLLETLARNPDATLSRRAKAYLVEEARRMDTLHGPLVDRADLPSDLAMKLYWWVAAGLKRQLLEKYVLDETFLHEAIEESVHAASSNDNTRTSLSTASQWLLDRGGREVVQPRAIIGYVRSDRTTLACEALSQQIALDKALVQDCLLNGPMEALAVLCREAGFSRNEFLAMYGVCSSVWPGTPRVISASEIAKATQIYDQLTDRHTRKVFGYWRCDPAFRRAECELAKD